jgi:hypothetical protein
VPKLSQHQAAKFPKSQVLQLLAVSCLYSFLRTLPTPRRPPDPRPSSKLERPCETSSWWHEQQSWCRHERNP